MIKPARLNLSLVLLFLATTAARSTTAAEAPRIVAVSLFFDDQPIRERPPEGGLLEVYQVVEPELRKRGVAIVRSVDRTTLIGGDSLRSLAMAELRIDLRAPAFTFNVVLLPAQWTRTKGGEVALVDPASREVLWSQTLKIPIKTAEGRPRWEAAFARLPEALRRLPRVGSAGRSPELARLLQLNDIETDEGKFIDGVRLLMQIEPMRRADVLVQVAADPRMGAAPDLRRELLRRAVLNGAGIERALGQALSVHLLTAAPDGPFAELLVEGLSALGVDPGDAILPYLDRFPLADLLRLRRRFAFKAGTDALNRRIARLGRTALERARDFAEAEQLLGGLPMEEMSHANRVALRDALYARIDSRSAAEQYRRLIQHFPEAEFAPPPEDEIDRDFLAGATTLKGGEEGLRLAWYRRYLASSPRGAAAGRLISALNLRERLEKELAEALGGATTPEAEQAALVANYGPHSGAAGQAALARLLLAQLGQTPDAERVREFVQLHPDIGGIEALTRQTGLIRDPAMHVLLAAPGDDLATVKRRLGNPNRSANTLTRSDLSPAAFIGSDLAVPETKGKQLQALEYPDLGRILLAEGRVFRIVVLNSRGLFHHGVKIGDTRAEAIAVHGPPTRTRSLMFGRELISWDGIDGARSLTVVMDDGRVSLFYEESPTLLRQAMATIH